ncbi:MAG: CAP domain-containing protein [Pyrinomonadaceae bacterium]
MYKKLFPILGIFAALAMCVVAQTNSPQNVSGPNVSIRLTEIETGLARYLESDDDETTGLGRPRVVETKTAGVKASVLVKIASIEHTVFDLVNQKRAESGLKALAWSDSLEGIARLHSQNMADFNFFSHRGLDGKMVSDRADEAGLSQWQAIGENIAFNRGFQDPIAKAVDLWLNSPSHKNNMLSEKWRDAAVGVAIGEDGSYYFTQVFLKRK